MRPASRSSRHALPGTTHASSYFLMRGSAGRPITHSDARSISCSLESFFQASSWLHACAGERSVLWLARDACGTTVDQVTPISTAEIRDRHGRGIGLDRISVSAWTGRSVGQPAHQVVGSKEAGRSRTGSGKDRRRLRGRRSDPLESTEAIIMSRNHHVASPKS